MSGETGRRAGWYHGWNIVAVCIACQAGALALTMNCFSLFLNDWTREFNAPVSTLSMSLLLFSLVAALATPLAGAAADRYPARWIFAPALLGVAAAHVAIGFATQAWQVVAIYAVLLPWVLAFGATVPAQALVSRWFVRRAGLAMGVTSFGLDLSGVIFPPLIVALLPLLGWRMVWWAYAAAIVVIVIPLIVMVIRDRPTAEEGAWYVGAKTRTHRASTLTMRQVLGRRNLWILLAAFLPSLCAVMGLLVNVAPLVASYGYAPAVAGLLISIGAAAGMLGKIVAGLMSDRVGNRIPFVLLGLLCAAGLLTIAFLGGRATSTLYFGFLLTGISGGAWTLLASATSLEFGAEGFGKAFGVILAFAPLGSLVPTLVAKAQELTGSYVPGLVGLAALTIGGAGVALLLKERQSGADENPAPVAAPEPAA